MHRKDSKKKPGRTKPTPKAQAALVLAFINSAAPDFITTAVQDVIDQACEHLDPHQPFTPYYEPDSTPHDADILTALCKRTTTLSLGDIENTHVGVARHVAAILANPQTPASLQEAVLVFVTDAQNLRPYGKPSLAEEMTRDVKLLARVMARAREDDEAPEDKKG